MECVGGKKHSRCHLVVTMRETIFCQITKAWALKCQNTIAWVLKKTIFRLSVFHFLEPGPNETPYRIVLARNYVDRTKQSDYLAPVDVKKP